MQDATSQPAWAVTPYKIEEAVRRIVLAAHPVKIILFGSQARGTAHEDSDLDLLVIEHDVPNRVAEMVRLERTLRGMVLATDILVIGEKEFAERAEAQGSVYYEANRSGKILYDAA